MAFKSGEAYIAVTPSLSGWQESIRRQLREALGNEPFEAPVQPKVPKDKGPKDGAEYGGAFGESAKRRIDAALRDLPEPKVGADTSEADRKIGALRARLTELRDKRVNLELSDAQFLAGVARVKTELDDLARKSPTVTARFNAGAASAELASFSAEVDRLDGRSINIDTSQSVSRFGALLTAGLSLGPALIPVAAAITAAFGAIGTGAILGVGGLGTLALGFSNVGDAVKALGEQHKVTGQTAAQSAAQQLSSANSVRSAQDSLLSSEQSLTRAKQQVGIAAETAARNVATAIARQRQSEIDLIDSQRSALRAQQALTQARLDAQRALEDMAFSVQDNTLAQRRAQLDLRQAQSALNQIDPTLGGGSQREEAQLALDEAQQRLTELQVQGQRLASDKADADRKGVEGSRQVTAGQDAVIAANERVVAAQGQVRESAAAVTRAQVDGARQVELAEQGVVDSKRQVEAAERGLTLALAQQAAQASKTTSEQDKLAESMAKLSPAGQAFARFIDAELRPKFEQLRATAQQGLLPGVEQGIRNALPLAGVLNQTVGIIASAFGDLATRAGAALNDPFWTGFFGFIRDEAGPSTRTFGEIIGNLAKGAAGLIQAFKPIWDDMGAGLLGLSEKFANFGVSAAGGGNQSFNAFLQYVQDTWPAVKELFVQLGTLVGHLIEAFSGQGLSTLNLLNTTLGIINSLPPGTLQLLIDLFIAYRLMKLASGVIGEIQTAVTLLGDAGILGALKKIRGFGGLGGALGPATTGTVAGDLGGAAAGGAAKGGLLSKAGRFAGKAASFLGKGATVVGGGILLDDLTNGGVGKTLNLLSGQGFTATPGMGTGSEQLGNLFSGNISQAFGAGPAVAGDKWDIRNMPETLVSAWHAASGALSGIWSSISGTASSTWGAVGGAVSTATQGAVSGLQTAWTGVSGFLGGLWGSIGGTASAAWGAITSTIGGWSAAAWSTVSGWFNQMWQGLTGIWNGIWQAAQNIWNGLYNTVTGVASSIWGAVTGWFNRLAQDMANAWQHGVDLIRTIWNGLIDVIKIPVNFVIDPIYDAGIRGVWNAIAGTFGLGQLPYLRPLAAGGVLPGYAPGRDTVPAMLSAGEGVLVPEAVRGLGPGFVYAANEHFSGGRARPSSGPGFAGGGILGAIESGWDWATGLFTDPAGTARRLFSSVTSMAIPGVGGLHDALASIPGKVVDAVIEAAKKVVASIGFGGSGGGAQRWAGLASQVLAMLHQPASSLGALLRRIDFESSGNPNAINLSDSNARAWHPSQGLMQTIPSTFTAYAGPFIGRGITDPLANIYAGSNYAIHRYGSVAAIDPLIRPRGYRLGGRIPGDGSDTVPILTTPGERVLTTNENAAFEHLVDALTTRKATTTGVLNGPRLASNRAAKTDSAVLSRALGQEVRAAMADFQGTLRIVDDGRNGLATIARRQGVGVDRRG